MEDRDNEALKAFLDTEDGKKLFYAINDSEEFRNQLIDDFIKCFLDNHKDAGFTHAIIDRFYDDIKYGMINMEILIDRFRSHIIDSSCDTRSKEEITYHMSALMSHLSMIQLINSDSYDNSISILKNMKDLLSEGEEYIPSSHSNEELLSDSDLRKRIKYTRNPMQKKKYQQMLSGYKYTGIPANKATKKKKYRNKK